MDKIGEKNYLQSKMWNETILVSYGWKCGIKTRFAKYPNYPHFFLHGFTTVV